MASVDLIQLSSPPRQFISYSLSSSPSLPSPRDICRGILSKPKNKTWAAPPSQVPRTSLTTAGALLKSQHRAENANTTTRKPASGSAISREMESVTVFASEKMQISVEESEVRNLSKPSAENNEGSAAPEVPEEKAARKPRTKKLDVEDATGKAKPARKSRAKRIDTESLETDAAKEKTARQPRMKQGEAGIQTKIPKGQVKKSLMSDENKVAGSSKSKDADTVSKHFPPTVFQPSSNSIDHGLLIAVRRRTDWTPPAATASPSLAITPVTINFSSNDASSLNEGSSDIHGVGFSDLLGSFEFRDKKSKTAGKFLPVDMGTRKRKLIELVDTNFSTTTAVSVPKKKSLAKKARTITDLATSAFVETGELPNQSAPLLQYFAYESSGTATSSGSKAPGKSRSRSPVKSSTRAKLGTSQAPILLSPDSALKQMVNQDFVFGTSSQLAREDSPALLKALHEAMQTSNKVDIEGVIAASAEGAPVDILSTVQRDSLPSNTRKLWSAAFRDPHGKLLDVEVVDLAGSPANLRKAPKRAAQEIYSSMKEHQLDDAWRDIDDLESVAPLTEQSELDHREKAGGAFCEMASVPQIQSRASAAEPARTQHKHGYSSSKSKAATKTVKRVQKSNPTESLSKPDYASYTTAQLAKEIASYHFKPVKSRNQMIALLEKCWEGKQKTALAALPANKILETCLQPSDALSDKLASSSHASTTSPKRPRGRPRKDGTLPGSPKASPVAASTNKHTETRATAPITETRTSKKSRLKVRQAVDEISDSDTLVTPSPPRQRSSLIRAAPIPLKLLSTSGDTSPAPSPESLPAYISAYITRAVLEEAPTKDISKPNWHEKILLYDPIILEDLTLWLNTGALEKAGWDGEVDPKDVKKWCESKSICCVWRQNLRGGSRTRY